MTKKRKKTKEPIPIPKWQTGYLSVTTKTTKEETWIVDEVSEDSSYEDIQKGLANSIYILMPIDEDRDKAVVLSVLATSTAKVMARMHHSGGSNSCEINYKTGL